MSRVSLRKCVSIGSSQFGSHVWLGVDLAWLG